MIEGLLRWLARLLAGILERYSDPSLEAKLDAFHVRAAAADQAAKEAEAQALQSEAQYRESAARRQEWQARVGQSYQEAVALEQLVPHGTSGKWAKFLGLFDNNMIQFGVKTILPVWTAARCK